MKSEAKVELSMIWPVFGDMTPQVLPQVLFLLEKGILLSSVHQLLWMIPNRNVNEALRIQSLFTTVRKPDKLRGWTDKLCQVDQGYHSTKVIQKVIQS